MNTPIVDKTNSYVYFPFDIDESHLEQIVRLCEENINEFHRVVYDGENGPGLWETDEKFDPNNPSLKGIYGYRIFEAGVNQPTMLIDLADNPIVKFMLDFCADVCPSHSHRHPYFICFLVAYPDSVIHNDDNRIAGFTTVVKSRHFPTLIYDDDKQPIAEMDWEKPGFYLFNSQKFHGSAQCDTPDVYRIGMHFNFLDFWPDVPDYETIKNKLIEKYNNLGHYNIP